jgi:hypothetical protein
MERYVRATMTIEALLSIPRPPQHLSENSFVLLKQFCAQVPSCRDKY